MPVLDVQALIENRVDALRRYHKETGIEKAELDVSGGVDSAVMLGLLALALGPENVIAVYQGIDSSPESLERAREVAEVFGVKLIEIDLSGEYRLIVSEAWKRIGAAHGPEILAEVEARMEADPTVKGSLRSCLRAPVGRFVNRMMGGGLRHGTGNECEDRFLRFYQKGGDGEVDTNPLAMLSKGEVLQLAVALGVPRSIIEAKPSPDLWGTGEGHNDEDELMSWLGVPFTYSRVDADTGEYTYVGTIERMSRFLGLPTKDIDLFDCTPRRVENILFSQFSLCDGEMPMLVNMAYKDGLFPGYGRKGIKNFLKAARRANRITLHKLNPNIPTLGSRKPLVDKGILTDEIPA